MSRAKGRHPARPLLWNLIGSAALAFLAWSAGGEGVPGTGGGKGSGRIAVFSSGEGKSPPSIPGRERLLVGVNLNGREVEVLEVLREGKIRFYVPLEPFLELSGCSLIVEGEVLRVETPLGTVALDAEDVVEIEGVRYLRQETIEEKLATPVVFDEGAFALRFDLAWRPRTRLPRMPRLVLTPDVEPPELSLSTIRIDAQYLDSASTGRRFDSDTLLAGRVAGGRWQVRWQDAFDTDQRWQDYAWLRLAGNQLWLAGHQRVQLHPLLPGLELTGLQSAWTNQPLALFPRTSRPGELLPRRLRSVDSFDGTGPAAGVAELRLDGRVVARRTIGLDGRYAFYDVPASNRELQRAEVYVYDRHNLAVPVAIQEQTRSASDLLLTAGAVLHQGGLGYGGNLAQDALDGNDTSALSGFYQGRYGLNERFTVEAAVQSAGDRVQVMSGFVARLNRAMVATLGVGAAGGVAGYALDLDGDWSRWRLRARSHLHPVGFQNQGSEETFDHLLEIGTAPSDRFDLAVIARSRRQPGQRRDFILPAVAWRPRHGPSFRARPDEKGDYVADLAWRFGRHTRFGAHHQDDRASLDLSRDLGRRAQLFFGAETGGAQPQRYSAALRRSAGGNRHFTWTAGALYADGELGYRIAASAAVLPGVLARIDWEDDPLPVGPGGRRERQLRFGVTTDLAWSRGRLLAARSLAISDDRGAIAGNVRVEAPATLRDYELEGLRVRVDGRPRGRTLRGGSFFIGDLPAGVYRLDLDSESLPIELAPERTTVVAAVAGSAVTRVDFVVRPELGLAGRISDRHGAFVAGIQVEVVDLEGRRAGAAVSDRFGLFRIDGLAIGRYTLRVIPERSPQIGLPPPSRSVEIRDEFLFDQDLVLAPASDGPPDHLEDEQSRSIGRTPLTRLDPPPWGTLPRPPACIPWFFDGGPTRVADCAESRG
jgi:hypothetical protein